MINFRTPFEKVQVFFLNLIRITGTLHEDFYKFLSYLFEFFLYEKCFDKVIEQIQTHILCSMTFFPSKNLEFYEILWKNVVRARQATDDNTTHAHCMRDT